MKRTPTEDSRILEDSIRQIIDEKGRGGLSYVADQIGMTPAALQKRLRRRSSAFDQPTLRAVLLVLAVKSQQDETIEPPEPAEDTQAQP